MRSDTILLTKTTNKKSNKESLTQNKMKVLAISDTHGNIDLVRKSADLANKEKADIVIHAGDVTWFTQKQKGIVKPLTENKRETFLIHGNHETKEIIDMISSKYSLVKNIHAKGIEKNGIGIFGSGTTDWGFREDSYQIFNELKQGHEKIKMLNKKIMVSHSPPKGSLIELLGLPGSYGVRKAIDEFQPDFLICGHIHEGRGIKEKIGKTTVINAAFTPTIFEI